jgi:hypothetical protein
MAAIVATLALPVAGFFAWIASLVFGFSFYGLVTFGGTLSGPLGLLAWWAACLIPSWIYAGICLRTN